MMVPATAVLLPLFLEINSVHLVNTAASVILPALSSLSRSLSPPSSSPPPSPRNRWKQARIDGCGEVRVCSKVAMPLAKPVLALLVFFGFVANWSNFCLPYVMLSDDQGHGCDLPVRLGSLISSTPALEPFSVGGSFLPDHLPGGRTRRPDRSSYNRDPFHGLPALPGPRAARRDTWGTALLQRTAWSTQLKIVSVNVRLVAEPPVSPQFRWRDGLPGSDPRRKPAGSC